MVVFNFKAATILVVEDDPDILDLVETTLSPEGYNLISARTADEGLKKFKENKQCDLIFTDLVLPHGVSGLDLIKQITKLDPDCTFLLGSGYSEKGRSLSETLKGKRHISYLSKPYDLDELLKECRYLLGKKSLSR